MSKKKESPKITLSIKKLAELKTQHEQGLLKNYSLKAVGQYDSLTKLAGIESIQEKARKNLEVLTGRISALDYASELTKAASSLSKSSFMNQLEKQKTFEELHKPATVEI